jgi:hypothetical protein
MLQSLAEIPRQTHRVSAIHGRFLSALGARISRGDQSPTSTFDGNPLVKCDIDNLAVYDMFPSAGNVHGSTKVDLLVDDTWEGISARAEADFLASAEEMLKGTLALGHGADLRATTAMGIFGAIGAALFAAAATLFVATPQSWPPIAGTFSAAIVLFIAAVLCGFAARPQDFYIAGFEPRNLLNSSAKSDQFRTRVLIAVMQDRIDHNRRATDKAAALVSKAFMAALVSPMIAFVVFISVFLAIPHVEMARPQASAKAHASAAVAPRAAVGAGEMAPLVHRP